MSRKAMEFIVKSEAERCLIELGVCMPYLLDFRGNDQVYLFDNGEARRIDPNSVLGRKIKSIEDKSGVKVYAVIHSIIDYVGENYAFLCVSPYPEDWRYSFIRSHGSSVIRAYSYVWNVSKENCSEFGSILLTAAFGSLRRVG